MSYGMFSVPTKPDERPCPVCGAMMPIQADMCWLCLQKSIKEEAPPPNPKPRQQSPRYEPGPLHFDITFAVLALMAILICGVLAYEMPGALVVPAIVVMPVLIRSLTKTKQSTSPSGASSNQPGHQTPPPEPSVFMQLLSWIAIVSAIGMAAFGAFCAAFFAICTGGLAIGAATGSFDFFANFLIVCLMGGIVAAVIVATYVFRAARPRRN